MKVLTSLEIGQPIAMRTDLKSNIINLLNFFLQDGLQSRKGILDLLKAYTQSKILLDCELILAGSGDLFEEIKYLKKKEGYSKIKLLGWIDSNLISEYMKNVDVLVLPSYAEGFPNVIVEALWHSLPVISSNVGSISDSVIDDYNGNLFVPGDIDALKMLMENLVLNNQTMKTYSENSLKIAKNHSFYKNCEKLLKLISN